MAAWGTLRKSFVKPSASDNAESMEYVKEFFDQNSEIDNPKWKLDESKTLMTNFIKAQLKTGRRVAIVTSGSTIAPFDENEIYYMDGKSSGNRGAGCAEALLRRGYAVVFIHRSGSLKPFSRHFAKIIKNQEFMTLLKVDGDQIVVDADENKSSLFKTLLSQHEEASNRVLSISFGPVQQYLHLLRIASMALDAASDRGLLLLAAAVHDFYVPQEKHGRPTSTDDDYSLQFVHVPNLIGFIRNTWCPKAFVTTFKLEVEHMALSESSHKDIEKYGTHAVLGNVLSTRRNQMLIVTEREEFLVTRPSTGEELESPVVSHVVRMHREFSHQSTALRRSKELLLLSAKFCMMKEKDKLNIDADGNLNVDFKVGIKIKSKNKCPSSSPIYKLEHIFQNKSHSARCHVWEKVGEKVGEKELVVVFSPAGTPNAIKDLWGDFWNGWAESEVKEIRSKVSNVSLSSALNVMAAPLTGDYSATSALLEFVWKKVGSAWTDGEQTRIRQSVQNVLALALTRGLVSLSNINTDVRKRKKATYKKQTAKTTRAKTLTTIDAVDITEAALLIQKERACDDDHSDDSDDDSHESIANQGVRVHQTVATYYEEMEAEGLFHTVEAYMNDGYKINMAGYSMGGMLSQLLMFRLGEAAAAAKAESDLLENLNMVCFGTPRIGDSGFRARMKLMFCPTQLINVMHPSDTVHAFPPKSEGYDDAMLKVFLKDQGIGVGRRRASTFSALPTTRAIDRAFERIFATTTQLEPCELCSLHTHSTGQHRCRYCTERGTHRGADCPNRNKPCGLCGSTSHNTGEHRCKVCSQYGHRGRGCHLKADVGITELIAYFRYHNFLYYNTLLKKSVEFKN